jgi:hypothetical protein
VGAVVVDRGHLGAPVKDDRQRLGFDLGFAPDADPLAPGVVTDCVNFIPTARGMRTLWAPLFAGETEADRTFTSTFVLAHWTQLTPHLSQSNREYAASQTKLFVRTDRLEPWRDITYAGKTFDSGFWTFTGFGTAVIGAEGGQVLQKPSPIGGGSSMFDLPLLGTGTAVATAIAGAPTCCIVTSAERFVLAFNGRGGDDDTWNCSARDNHLSWTLSPATLASQGRLVEPPGPIMAAVPMGNDVLVYKPTGVVRGMFVEGDAEVWKWQKLPTSIGANGPRSVCQLPDGRHAVMNTESCWLFDGVQAVDVLDGRARDWFHSVVNNVQYNYGGMAPVYDGLTHSVWFTFKPGDYVSYTSAIVLNLSTGKLGHVQLPADMIVSTTDDSTNATMRVPGYFESTTHRMMFFGLNAASADWLITPSNSGAGTGVPVPMYIASGDTGDPFDLIDVSGVKLDVLASYDDMAGVGVELYSRDRRDVRPIELDTVPATPTTHISGGDRYAVRKSAHWHRARVTPNAVPLELAGVWLRASKSKSERGG